jgi:hypothetical protein
MSMIRLNGVLVNTFRAPVRRGAEAGEVEKDKLQIMGDVLLNNGESRKDLVTITVPDARKFAGQEGTEISLSVGVFAPAKGQVIFFVTA